MGLRFFLIDKASDEKLEIELEPEQVNALVLNRFALGFPVADIPVVPWPQHFGYATAEGRSRQDVRASGIEGQAETEARKAG